METPFKIYIDRLKEGSSLEICEDLSSDFLEVVEEDLSFPDSVQIQGKAYLADEHLVLHLNIHTHALIPCSICNQATRHSIEIADHYHSEPLNELSGPIFEFCELVREVILLKVPPFLECQEGLCPERTIVSKFLKKSSSESNFPFENL
jgi:uncharacterized metal-binding protein YceD (DUF177 family)